MTEIWNLSTLCRCCHSDGHFRSLRETDASSRGKETYEMLLRDALGVSIYKPVFEASSNICDACMLRLKDASSFKKQVMECEEKFQGYCKNEQYFCETVVKLEDDNKEDDIHWDTSNDNFPCPTVSTVKRELKIEIDIDRAPLQLKEEDEKAQILLKIKKDANEIKRVRSTKVLVNNRVKMKTKTIRETKTEDPEIKKEKKSKHSTFNFILAPEQGPDACCIIELNLEPAAVTVGLVAFSINTISINRKGDDHTRIVELIIEGATMFSCKTCGGVYANRKLISTHMKAFHKKIHKCRECHKEFTRKSNYTLHLETHKNTKGISVFECDTCGKRLCSKYSLIDHLNSHSNLRKFKCHICNKTYKNKSSLNMHLKWHYGIKKKVLCDLCGRSFNDKTNLNIHIKVVHYKIRSFSCDMCGRSYTAKKHLKAHIVAHMQSSVDQGISKPIFTCQICRKQFKCPRSFQSHRMLHDNKYQCRVCRKVSTDKEKYLTHLRTHFKSVMCPICCKVFTTPYAMKRHMDAHNGIKRHACETCGLKFVDKAQVKRHVLRKHNPNYVERVQCELCKRYVTDLAKHMEGHRHKKFSCEYCGKSYVENNALNRHMKVIHFGRVFTCDICKKNYMSMKSVNRHKMRVHKIKSEDVANVSSYQVGESSQLKTL